MKNFLSKLWSLSRADRVRTLAIDAVSLPSFCRVNMLKLVSVLVLILTIGSGNAWAGVRSGWTRVTSVAEITAGGTFIVGWENSANSNTVVPMINKPSTLTGTTGNNATSYLYSGTANASNNTTIDMSDKGSGATTNYEFEFVAGSSSETIAIKLSDNTYVGFYGSSNNNCRRYASVVTNASFTPTISSGIVTLTNVQYTSRKLSFNNNSSSYRFSNYSSSAKIVLYKKSSSCSNSVGVTKGSESHGEVTTIGSASVATCSGTASDRRVTITVTPDDCYDAPSTLTWTKSSGTVSASKQSGPTDNGDGTYSYVYQFAQNDNGAGTFGVTCTAKAAGKTVNFDAGPGSCLTSSLTETCDGSGVTLPAVTATGVCKGWTTFAGWATAAVSDSTTTSGVTLYAAGDNFVPASNGQTLYAVYSKAKGGSGFKLSLVVSSTTYYVGKQNGSNNYLSAETNSANAAIFTFDNGYLSYDDSGTKKYISITGNNTSLYVTTDKPAVTWTESGTTTYSYLTSAATRYLAYNGSASPVRFASYNNNSSYPQYFTKTSTATTYYCSDPNCCTQLASINGSFSFTSVGTTGATANWGWTGATTGISKNILKVYKESDNSLVATIDNISASATSQAITGLDPCTEYYVKLSTVSSGGGYCDGVADQTGASHVTFTTSSYTVTKTGVTNVTAASLSAIPATTCASGFGPITIEAASGYVLPAEITVTGASHTWNQASGALTISSVTGNVSITITPTAASCSGQYTFAYGATADGDGKNITDATKLCFEQVGSSNEFQVTGFTIPTTTQYYWVGYNGYFYDGSLGTNNAKSSRNQFKYMPVANLQGSSCGGTGDSYKHAAAGAYGLLRIYRNYSDDNLYVGFSPAGYQMRIGSGDSWTNVQLTQDGSTWTSDLVTLDAATVAKKYYINVWTGSSYSSSDAGVAINNWTDGNSTISSMVFKTGADTWNTTSGLSAGMRGKFRTWTDNCANNGYCHFVPYYRVTYNGNGAASGSTSPSTDVSCEGNDAARTVKAAANGFTAPTGKQFGGWATSAVGSKAYDPNDDIVLTASIELFAIWEDIDYTVTVNQNPNVSATTTGQTSTAHYNTTINLTTTVPSGYRFVNWTTSDGFSITNSTSATTASFTMPNKSVTVTANFQQTHTVDWYVGGSAPANKIGDDGQTTVVDHGGKISDFPATTPDGSPCDKTFVGWTNTSSYVHGTSPLFNDVAGSPTINADASFYAVFAEGGSAEYVLTSAASLTAGEYVIAAYDDANSKYLALTGAVSAASLGSNSDMVNETTGFTISEGKFTTLPTGACEFVLTAYTGETDNGFYIQNPADDKYLDYQTTTNRRLWFYAATDYVDEYDNPTTPWAAWYGVALSKDGFPDNGMYLKYVDETYSLMSNGSGTTFVRGYANDNTKYKPIYLFKKTGGATGHTINCTSCANSVTVSYSDPGSGNTMAVTKGSPIASGTSVKTCSAQSLTVTLTPATHYTVTNFAATGVAGVTTTNVGNVYTINIPANATGTLTLTPTFTEDAHVAINWNVNGVNQSIAATEGLTWVYSGGDLTALPSEPSVPAGCSGTKVFAGWSAKHSDATEEDASYYDDLFTTVGGAPTGISSAKTFYAVFATSSANPLAGETMWAEDFSGFSADDTPNTSYGSAHTGTTVYNSGSVTYACTNGGTTTKIYAANLAGGTSPEILVSKSNGQFDVTGIPTGGQTELTLTYKCNKGTTAFEVSSATGTVTVGDASVDGSTYTRTITISQSPSATNSFALTFKQTTSENARLDDISLVVPGSGTMTDYVTLCAPSYTITYNKNTEDAVTNLPSPTSVLQSTGSGTLSSTVPERATYTFSGWAETTSGAVAYAAGGSITGVTGDKTIYAVWEKTAVEEIILNYTTLERYVGDPTETLEVESVVPSGADMSVAWSSDNSSVASVGPATGVVTFGVVGTATITATSAVTGTTNAVCYVTVRNKPTVTFVDQIHNLDEDKDGTALSTYNIQDVAGTAVTFPDLADQELGENCDGLHYKFVGWTDEDNNTDPEDHLITSYSLANDVNKTFYAVWADGVEGVSYTKLTTNSFKTSPAKYVIGIENSETTYYLYSCSNTDANNSWGYTSNAPATNAPIQFTLSGTAGALVATSTEATARYLTPLTAKNFQMSATSKTVQLNADGTIHNPSNDDWTLQGNSTDLRWYSSTDYNLAHFYEVTAGSTVSYRTSCCTNNVPAPTVVATNTAYTVTLTWAAVAGATGYEVSWNGGAFEAATSPCVKSGLTASTDYIYKVRATYDPLVKCGALVASGNVTTDDVYTVTYSGGTGTGSCSLSGSVAPASYEAGATVTLAPTNSYSMTSNTFAAWVVKDADDNDVPVSNNQFTMPAKNVTVTATWTPVQDKYYDRMHDGTDGSHGGVQDGEGKYYLVREGCNYTVPTLTDDDDGDTDCHTTHYKLLGWIAGSHLKSDGSIKDDEESYIFQGGTTKSATGATYYAVWAIMTE